LYRNWTADQISDLLFYVAVGIIFGGRIGFVLIYQPTEILTEPLELLKFWAPGRSFHGGLVGVLLAVYIYGRRSKRKFLEITDFIAPAVPIGISFGRLGNFINGELWGRATDVPWGMVFKHVDNIPRHPSQLYELFLEGIVLSIWLLLYASKKRHLGAVSGMFAFGYGIFRFTLEFMREPDASHGFVALHWLTMGQVLSIPMIIIGLYFILVKR
jgi:phosphatidylglycerol:prolipoprotein diacylglycerol transferase